MKIKIFIYALCIFLISLLQSTVLDYISIHSIRPNLLLVFIVSVALLRGNTEGAVIGFFAGLSQDLISGKLLGFYSLLGMYLGLAMGSVNRRLYRENFFAAVFFMFISTIVYEWSVYFLNMITREKEGMMLLFRNVILPEAIYNCGVLVFMYVLVVKINDMFSGTERVARKY